MYTYVFKYFLDYSQNKNFIAPTYIVLSPIVKINYILIFYLKNKIFHGISVCSIDKCINFSTVQ